MKRIFLLVLGLALLAGVAALGFYASIKPSYVFGFGLAAAFLVPPAFLLFGQAIRSEDSESLVESSTRPSVRDLIADVESEEERIAILDAELRKIDVTVRVASRRQVLIANKQRLETALTAQLAEYDDAISTLSGLDDKISSTTVRDDVERVRKIVAERERGRVIVLCFGRREFSFSVRKFGNDLISSLFLLSLAGVEKMQGKKADPSSATKD